ncbi:MAG: hypothetical protein ACRDYA_06150 [Egibacteraceae bacterium]
MNGFRHVDHELVQARADARRLEKLTRDLEAARHELAQEQGKAREFARRLPFQEWAGHWLEGRSLRRWLMEIAGSKGEKLDRERRETAAATLQHDAAHKVAAGLAGEVTRLEAEVATLGDPSARYEVAVAEKERLHTERGDTLGRWLLGLAARRADALADRRELDEAIEAGNEVLEHLSVLAMTLRRASGFGLWDLVGGGAFVSMVKHGYIDDARSVAAGLQEKLLRFDRELADVAASGLGIGEVNLGLGLRFADVFLDGILPDFLVQTRIASARQTVDDTAAYVQQMLEWLDSLIDYADNAIRSCDQERAELLERY